MPKYFSIEKSYLNIANLAKSKLLVCVFANLVIMIAEKRTITVVTIKAVKKDAPCTIIIKMPSGKTLDMKLTMSSEGYTTVFTPSEVGKHTVIITYGLMEVPKSPFSVMVEVKVDVSRVVVRGFETRKYFSSILTVIKSSILNGFKPNALLSHLLTETSFTE